MGCLAIPSTGMGSVTPSHGSCLDPKRWIGAKESQLDGRVSQVPPPPNHSRGREGTPVRFKESFMD